MDLESTRQKSTEAEALQRLHGMSLRDACELVCLPPTQYRGADVPLDWLPSPAEIEAMVVPLRREKEEQRLLNADEFTPPLLRGDNA
ncbi:MAG: hypothetical protein AAFX06_16705 [Planctomycetota bacterium]